MEQKKMNSTILTSYETGKGIKFAEQDVFSEGCLPETAQSMTVDIEFQGKDIDELISKIAEYFDMERECIDINACDEDGRIDIQTHENEDGINAGFNEIELWKHGKVKLWSVNYSYQVEKVTREIVKL